MVQKNPSSGERQEETSAEDLGRIERYLSGEEFTFAEVDRWIRSELQRSYPRLAHEHEDLCQTVHGKLLLNLREGRYQGRSGLRTYVTGIAHHTAIDRLRRLYRNRALSESLSRQSETAADNPYRVVETRDDLKLVQQVLLALPQACRELWKLVFLEKLSYGDIGKKLSIPAGTVKSRMWHCRKKAAAALRRIRLRSPGFLIPETD